MDPAKRYVPILKGKAGEFDALSHLSSRVKDEIAPCFDIPPVEWDFDNDAPKTSIDAHIAKFPDKIAACWEPHRPFFVNATEISDHDSTKDGQHPLALIFAGLRAKNLYGIPVTSLGKSAVFQSAVASIIGADNRGVCLHIGVVNLTHLAGLLPAIDRLLSTFQIGHQDVDIIVDFGPITDAQLQTSQIAVNAILPQFPDLMSWRSFTLASAGMLEDMSNVGANTVARQSRTDWLLWTNFLAQASPIQRRPSFADYGITHPSYPQLDFRFIPLAAKIKYTAKTYWLLVKGQSFKRATHDQYRAMTQMLITQPEYCGPTYSWGDQYIYDCANNAAGTGTLRTWVAIGTNHHITFVTDQIASLSSLSGML